ncbi:MAG: sugar phosphate isomerase/epimerase family protein [Spirochaetota bacterium]
MRAGVCTIAFKDRPLDDALHLIAGSGARGIELWGRAPHLPDDPADRRALRGRLDDAGLELCALGSYYRPDGRTALRSGATAGPGTDTARDPETDPLAVLDASEDLRAPLVRIWPGARDYEACAEAERDAIVEEIRWFADEAARRGTKVVLERHSGTLTNSWDSAARVIEEISHDNVALCYQVPYPAPAEDLRTRTAVDIDRLLPLSAHAHLQNYAVASDGTLARTLLAEGVVDYAPLSAAVARSGYDGWAMVEFVGEVRAELSEAEALAQDVRFIASL